MPLKPQDVKTVEQYKKAMRTDITRLSADDKTKFWMYRDVTLPNATGKPQKLKVFLVLIDLNAIKALPLLKGKKPVAKGACGIHEGKVNFRAAAGKVPYNALKTTESVQLLLGGKPVVVPAGIKDTDEEGPEIADDDDDKDSKATPTPSTTPASPSTSQPVTTLKMRPDAPIDLKLPKSPLDLPDATLVDIVVEGIKSGTPPSPVFEDKLFDERNPKAKANLAKAIEDLGGKCYEISRVSYKDLKSEYDRVKTPNVFNQKLGVGPSSSKSGSGHSKDDDDDSGTAVGAAINYAWHANLTGSPGKSKDRAIQLQIGDAALVQLSYNLDNKQVQVLGGRQFTAKVPLPDFLGVVKKLVEIDVFVQLIAGVASGGGTASGIIGIVQPSAGGQISVGTKRFKITVQGAFSVTQPTGGQTTGEVNLTPTLNVVIPW